MNRDVDVLIIGAGVSGIGFAIQLLRQYNTRNFELIEKSDQIGGTWWVNSYPGCGCDVASHFYSYSFTPNPNWSQKFALQPEIDAYFKDVAAQYQIDKHVRVKAEVETARWDASTGTWSVTIQDLQTGQVSQRRCKVLVSAVGALSVPKKCDLPGASTFGGKMFHTAEWDHSFDWKDKEVVVIGNGCSATQAVPVMSAPPNAVKKLTQFSRQAHWLSERPNPEYSALFKWAMTYLPFAMKTYRALLYWTMERDFQGFDMETGAEIRKGWSSTAEAYIRANAPARYREFLVPKTEVGCKRRVNDTDYLACLHRENVELVYEDGVEEIVEAGVRTRSGKVVEADAIVLAHGFETQRMLAPMEIVGENGVSITDHWETVSEGAPSAYLGTCLSGFPNFFIMMGPNTLSGHLSVIYTTECQINLAMRLLKPVLHALTSASKPQSIFPALSSFWAGSHDVVGVRPSAERRDIDAVQEKAKRLVWASGCASWFIHGGSMRNTVMFPDWQYKFWLRSVFIPWKDFCYETSPAWEKQLQERAGWPRASSLVAVSAVVTVIAAIAYRGCWL